MMDTYESFEWSIGWIVVGDEVNAGPGVLVLEGVYVFDLFRCRVVFSRRTAGHFEKFVVCAPSQFVHLGSAYLVLEQSLVRWGLWHLTHLVA